MFYVIGSEDQSRVLLYTAPANRTKGVVEQFGASGVPIPCRINRTMVEHWYSVVPPLYRYITCASRFWIALTIFGISEGDFQRDQKKIPLLVRTFRGELSTGFGKDFENLSYTSRRNFQIRTLLNIFFDPFFQGVLCHDLNGWLFISQVVAGEKCFLSIVVLKW